MTKETEKITPKSSETALDDKADHKADKTDAKPDAPIEKGGPKGPEPTRFGDWESNGRCTDF